MLEKLQAIDLATLAAGAVTKAPDWVGKLVMPAVIGVASAAWATYVTVQVMEGNVASLNKQVAELTTQVTGLRIETAVLKQQVESLNHQMRAARP